MKYAGLLLGSVGALALAGGAAQAEHFHGWYVGLEGGGNWVQDWDFRSIAATHTHADTASFDTGWAVLATVGYAFDHNWRVELEGGYRKNDIKSIVTRTLITNTFDPHMKSDQITLMANVLYDIPLTDRFSFTVGAGAGGDRVDIKSPAAGSQDQWKFAYQGIAGVNYALGHRTSLFVDYRYLRVVNPDFDNGFNFATHRISADDLAQHTVTLGLRFDLQADEEAAPPPPPPQPMVAAPPPPAPRQFIVFFGFNKCNITSEADGVLSQAASTAKETGAASIRIVGHTDTVGSNKYNQKLSVCRANAAKSNLVAKGIAENTIMASGKGETELMVQTGDGVKEPQNRRATVDLQ